MKIQHTPWQTLAAFAPHHGPLPQAPHLLNEVSALFCLSENRDRSDETAEPNHPPTETTTPMKNRAATCCSWLRCVFAALILIVSPSVSLAQAGALTFSAASQQYVTVPNFHSLGVTTEVTVEFWARFTTTAAQAAFGLDPDSSANRCLAHLNDSDTNIYWDFGDISNGGRVSVANSGGSAAGWTHYAFVASQSGNFMKIYINGTEVASVASFNAFETAVASALRIGGGGADFFTGSIDEFRVWNVARTPTQIAASRTSPVAGNATGLPCISNSTKPAATPPSTAPRPPAPLATARW